MKKAFLIVAAFSSLVACGGGKCDSNLTSVYEDCGIEVPDAGDGDGDAVEIECTDTLAEQTACINDCNSAADCAAFDSTSETYLDAVTAWGECTAACVTPA